MKFDLYRCTVCYVAYAVSTAHELPDLCRVVRGVALVELGDAAQWSDRPDTRLTQECGGELERLGELETGA
jgi:hypothetical protein